MHVAYCVSVSNGQRANCDLVSGLVLAGRTTFFSNRITSVRIGDLLFLNFSRFILRLLTSQTRHENSFRWCCLLITILFSTVSTTAGVLCCSPPACVLSGRNPQQFLYQWLMSSYSLILITSMLITNDVTPELERKSMWGSFATAEIGSSFGTYGIGSGYLIVHPGEHDLVR